RTPTAARGRRRAAPRPIGIATRPRSSGRLVVEEDDHRGVADEPADEGADLVARRLLDQFGVLGGEDDPAGLLGEGAARLAEVVLAGAGAQAQPPGGDLGLVALGVDL